MGEIEKAQLIFLDAIEQRLRELIKTQAAMNEGIASLRSRLDRPKKFKMIPDRNSKTNLIQEVTLIEVEPDKEPKPSLLALSKQR